MPLFAKFIEKPSRGVLDKLRTGYESFRIASREKRRRQNVPMSALVRRNIRVQNGTDLVFVTHNDLNLIPFFLKHYRSLGVSRFIAVDDASTDGTREFLLEQSDVDIWTSPVRYSEARRGRQWREQLFEIYGKKRWYINVDSDELLVFAHSETRTISDLIKALEAAGDKRLAAPMLDMYSGGGTRDYGPDDPPWLLSDHFDMNSYDVTVEKRGVSIKGGPRGRKFGEDNELMKYPVIYWDDSCYFGSSPHRPLPYGRNFPKTWGALLHFKFFVDYKEKIAEAVREKQHFGGSAHYVKLLDEIEQNGAIDLYDGDVSVKFSGSHQLIDLGFITPIDWDSLK
ncbi:glycosyltransferase family 2 protein [Agrobacterium sp. BA1120]|uniref:glycosyltransferase family 2 protein n=1 Tax=Agrobacterium sp. BA1120 TaxID=3228927 RepID=UPI00336A095B